MHVEASGSTNIYEAMETALNDRPSRVILLTDGMPTSSSPEQIIDLVSGRRNKQQFNVSTVGVGDDMGRQLLSTLAQKNGGSYIFYP